MSENRDEKQETGLNWAVWTWNDAPFAVVLKSTNQLDVMLEYVALTRYMALEHETVWNATQYIMRMENPILYIITPKPDIADSMGFKEVIRVRIY